MKALTFQGKELISYATMDDPSLLQPTDAIVQVKMCAICGSDLHVYHEHEKGLDHGTAMGHEFVGEIVALGKEVKNLQKGDLVMSPFTTNCGNCFYCNIGLTCRCEQNQLFGWVQNGNGLQGGQAEYVRVPLASSTLKRIPEGATLEEGLLMGDIMSTGFYCAKQAEINPKGVFAIIGCGPVGLMTLLGSLEYGAEKLLMIDTVDERLAIAKKLGATTINPKKQNALAIIQDATHGRGVDAVMEVVGSSTTLQLGYELLRPGGILSAVGVCNDPNFGFTPNQAYDKNLTYRVGRCPARYMMDELTPIVQKHKYDFSSIITHRLPLRDGVSAYETFSKRKEGCLKVVLSPTS
jgi:threonine dehydrogenase-like Zn-dependent dehydrogenase